MKLHPAIKCGVYLLVILLSLAALLLVFLAPSGILNSRAVYQGF